MALNGNQPSMHQQIFHMGFSTETVSAYLLCCGLTDGGKDISIKNLTDIWNGTQEALIQSLETLKRYHILREVISAQDGNHVYELTELKEWKATACKAH